MEGVALTVVIADKGYDKQEFVDAIEAKGGEAVIPSRKNRTTQRDIDGDRYKDRNLVEQFWSKAKQYRRIATRYEKTARKLPGVRSCSLNHGAAAVDCWSVHTA